MSAPVGTWFWHREQGKSGFSLWQMTEAGPHYVGMITSEVSADFICERCNERASKRRSGVWFWILLIWLMVAGLVLGGAKLLLM